MRRPPRLLEELIYSIIGAFFEVYNTLGYGFLEHLYLKALERELLARGLKAGLLLHFGPEPKSFRLSRPGRP